MEIGTLTPIVNPENPAVVLVERVRLERNIKTLDIFCNRFRELYLEGSDNASLDKLQEMKREKTDELIRQRGFRRMTSNDVEEIEELYNREMARRLEPILRARAERVERAGRARTD